MSNNISTEESTGNPALDLNPEQKFEIARRDARKKMLDVARVEAGRMVTVVFGLGRDHPELGRQDIGSDFKWAWNHTWDEEMWKRLPDSITDPPFTDDDIPF